MMRISRVYQPSTLAPATEIALDARNTTYLVNVLRLKPGDEFCLFNGTGNEYRATLVAYAKRTYGAKIHTCFPGITESCCQITLGQAIARPDHMDWAIQKAVELGVFAIQPLITAHVAIKMDASRLSQKLQHWQNIAISASEQCGRCIVPTVYPPAGLSPWLANCQQVLRLVAHPKANTKLPSNTRTTATVALLIGPEGGLSDTEVRLAENYSFQPLYLGPRILRTETAALAAITLLQQQLGDM